MENFIVSVCAFCYEFLGVIASVIWLLFILVIVVVIGALVFRWEGFGPGRHEFWCALEISTAMTLGITYEGLEPNGVVSRLMSIILGLDGVLLHGIVVAALISAIGGTKDRSQEWLEEIDKRRDRRRLLENVRKKLVEVAKKGETITYGEVMQLFNIPRDHPEFGIKDVVGDISNHEHSKDRPRLSAIVVKAGSQTESCPNGCPDGSFFGLSGLCEDLARSPSDFSEPLSEFEQDFVKSEQKRVWMHWRADTDV